MKNALSELLNRSNRKHARTGRIFGASWANYDRDAGRYGSLYFRAGLDRLGDLGYSVIFAI